MGFFFLDIKLTSHLSELNSMDQFNSHCSYLCKSFCRVSGSVGEFIVK